MQGSVVVHGGDVRVAVVGANGFVGRKLTIALVEADYDVISLSRRAPEIAGATGRAVDVADEAAVTIALGGCQVAFYLVHSLSPDPPSCGRFAGVVR